MALQLFALLGVAAWGGQQLDKKIAASIPYFTILFVLTVSAGFFYILVRELNRKDEP